MRPLRFRLSCCFLYLFACSLAACGEEAGPNDPISQAPCGGACAASACVLGVCVEGGNVGEPDLAQDTGAEDEPDGVDSPEDLVPDDGPEDLSSDVPDDIEEDLGAEDEPDATEDEPDVSEDEPDAAPVCVEDGDCPEGDICDSPEGEAACVPGCREDETCGVGEVCQESVCVEGCRADEGCRDREICEEGACVRGCREDEGCAEGSICEDMSCRRGCREDEACTDRQYCEPETWTCETGCVEGRCPEGSACELATRECVEGACNQDGDCAQGFFCNEAMDSPRCLQGCDEDDQCGDLRCEVSTNRCVCDEDAQCEGEEVCISGRCEASCTNDEMCGEGAFCDRFTQVCVQACQDDEFEPNDDIFPGVNLLPFGAVDARMCFVPEAASRDCYNLRVEPGRPVQALLDFSHDEGDLNLHLYRDVAQQVAFSNTDADTERVAVQAAGDYVVCVESEEGAVFESDYTLTVDLVCQESTMCQEAQAAPLSLGPDGSLELMNQVICGEGEQHLSVFLDEGDTLLAEFVFEGQAFRIDAALMGPDCEEIAQLGEANPETRLGEFVATEEGLYTLRITNEYDTARPWRAVIQRQQAPTCALDRWDGVSLEPNEASEQARVLPVTQGDLLEVAPLSLCVGDEDWFAVPVQGGDVLLATVRQDASDPTVEVSIYDPRAIVALASATELGAQRSAQTPNVGQGGMYLVKVSTRGDVAEEGTPYSLSLLTTGQVACVPDTYEGNDDASRAALLGNGSQSASICGGDVDWYLLPVHAGDVLDVNLTYEREGLPQGLGATLYGPGGADDLRDFFLRDGDSNIDQLASYPDGILVTALDEGDWLLEVTSNGLEHELEYNVEVSIGGAECSAQDELDPDNECGDAQALFDGQRRTGLVCGPVGDEDWYAIDLDEGEDLDVRVEHFHFGGNLEAEIYRPDGSTLEDFSYNAGPNFERLHVEDASAGTWCVRIFARSPLVQNDYLIEAVVR